MTQPSSEDPAGRSEPTMPISDPSASGGQPPYAPQNQSEYPPQAPPQHQGHQPAAPQYQQPPIAQGQYQGYPPAPPQQYQGQYPQMSQQPPMPNPAYGYPQPKSKIAAGLLGIFLGGLGIHRFYLGYTTIGIIQVVLTVFLGVFTFGLIGLWGLVEGIMILAGASYFQRDAKGIPLRE